MFSFVLIVAKYLYYVVFLDCYWLIINVHERSSHCIICYCNSCRSWNWYLFSCKQKNNTFKITIKLNGKIEEYNILIPDGNYDYESLQDYLNNTYFTKDNKKDNKDNGKYFKYAST